MERLSESYIQRLTDMNIDRYLLTQIETLKYRLKIQTQIYTSRQKHTNIVTISETQKNRELLINIKKQKHLSTD